MIVCVGGEQITENLAMVQPILCVHSTFYLAKYGLVCTLYHRMYPRIPTKKILSYKILDTEYSPPPHFRMFYSSRSHLSKNGSMMRNNSGAPLKCSTVTNTHSLLVTNNNEKHQRC